MLASSPEFMPCADRHPRQTGAAIVTAMLAVLLVASIAAALLADLGQSIDVGSGLHDQAQARQLARGAVDWARNVLADDKKRSTVDHAAELWATPVPPIPVEEGEIGGEIVDLSGRFNLNNLAPQGKADDTAAAQFERLLVALGIAPQRAQALRRAVLARLVSAGEDAGPVPGSDRSAVSGPLLDVAELAALPGFDAPTLARLGPFVAALRSPSKINVNTAPAEVLQAVIRGLELADARALVAERERAWFRHLGDLQGRLPPGASLDASASLDVQSSFFLVTSRARYGRAMVKIEALLERSHTWPEVVWLRIP